MEELIRLTPMSDDKLKIAVNRPFQAGSDKHVMLKLTGIEHLPPVATLFGTFCFFLFGELK